MGSVELEPRIASALCALVEAFDKKGLAYALIGATALLLREARLDRTTRDLDFAVAVETTRPRLPAALKSAGFTQVPKVSHRFVSADGQVRVDILPLDDRAVATGKITFAEGGSIPSAGLREAIRHASEVPVGVCRVPVAPLPILVALKLVAAVERYLEDRDLRDAFAMMRDYGAEGERRFLEVDYDAHPGLLLETAGAFLLARDVLPLLEAGTARYLRRVVVEILSDVRMNEDRALGERCLPLLRAFASELGVEGPPPNGSSHGDSTL